MTAYEMMLSESQERMLMILKPGREAQAEAIFEKWELDFAVIGITTDTGRLVVKHKGKVEADMPVGALVDEAPLYERPWVRRRSAVIRAATCRPIPTRRRMCWPLAEDHDGLARPGLAPLDLGAV
jgi:phosphoribosylformylglycinamidine (FGAM) synthase-like enzyme